MIRGTTAQFKFKLPCAKEELQWAKIKFWQSQNPSTYLPITKNLDHCSVSPDSPETIYVSLTPEETLWFSDKYKAKVQLRAMKNDGTTFANKEKLVTVYSINDDFVDDLIATENEQGWIILDGESII